MVGRTVTPDRRRRPGSVAHLQRRARPGVHLHRPSAPSVVRAGGADRGVDPVRPCRRRVEHLCRLVGRGGRRRVRRERGVALDRRPRRPARRGRRRVRQRRHRRQPVGAAGGALEVAGRRRRAVRPHPWADHRLHRRPLLGRPGCQGDGRRHRTGRRPTRAAGSRPRRSTPRSPASPTRTAAGCSPSSPRRGRRTPGSSTISSPRPTAADASARGSTSTGRTAAPASPLRACATCSPASSEPTASSSIPHKWLFAPFDSCALVYRDPEIARHAHTQHAEYLDVLHDDHDHASAAAGWNTSDYAHHLTRRARGLPFWFSLATYGTDAYTAAIETTLADRPGRRPPRRRRRAPRADPRAGAVDRPVPPPRLDGRRLPGVERRAVAPRRGVRHARRRGRARRCCAGASSTPRRRSTTSPTIIATLA